MLIFLVRQIAFLTGCILVIDGFIDASLFAGAEPYLPAVIEVMVGILLIPASLIQDMKQRPRNYNDPGWWR